jgi:long-chain acyl-CoA synthetase
MTTLVDVFRLLEAKRGEFVVYDDGYRVRRHTYAEVTRAARGFAGRLAAQGIRQGDTMLLWGENCGEWLAAYWGSVIAGVIVVPIDYRSSPAFAERVARIVDAKVALVGEESRFAHETPFRVWTFAEFDWHADGAMPEVALGRDDTAQVVFTSGATADPKGVVVRHRNLLANLVPVSREVAKYRKYAWPFFPIRFLNLLPLSHLFGQSMATNIPPLVDGTVVFMRSFNPHDIVRRVKEWRISVIVCVPKILDVLKEHAARIDPIAADPPPGLSIKARWWRYRRLHRALGLKFWGFIVGAAPLGSQIEEYWKRLGFVVIQGYGLTETAPIVTLNHPFKTSTGSVGTPIAGVEVKVAEDGEILVRGENVTTGYFEPGADSRRGDTGGRREGVEGGPGTGTGRREPTAREETGHRTPTTEHPRSRSASAGRHGAADGGRVIDEEGWLHTGDIGERDAQGRLFIRGRKKEMIVRADGLNVFPDDVERVLGEVEGVVESAVVGKVVGGDEQVHAVVVLAHGMTAEQVVAKANALLPDHQRVRGVSVWTAGPLPRTEGTRKLKRQALKQWVAEGVSPVAAPAEDPIAALLTRFAGTRAGDASFEALGLSSLDRVELMVALEDTFQTRIDEAKFAEARSIGDLRALMQQSPQQPATDEPVVFPSWNRRRAVRWIRRASLATWILPLARAFAWIRTNGVSHLDALDGPVVFAANHQSHFDVPVILAAMPGRWRARVAPAMAKEFFKAHFFPAAHTRMQVFTNSLNYYLAAFFFNAFPLPQREAGARQTLRYIGDVAGDGYSVLIFPEGVRSETEDIRTFRPGIGMIASRLNLPVVPVRIEGVNRVLHPKWKMARPGRVCVTFGRPMRLHGDDYAALAKQVEEAVRGL